MNNHRDHLMDLLYLLASSCLFAVYCGWNFGRDVQGVDKTSSSIIRAINCFLISDSSGAEFICGIWNFVSIGNFLNSDLFKHLLTELGTFILANILGGDQLAELLIFALLG
jgi:hypothetical protein